MKLIYAYYDLRIAPLSFDFIHYLAIACAEARKQDALLSVTLFYPSFRQSNFIELGYKGEYKNWKLSNVLVRICHLCPTVVEVTTNRSTQLRFSTPHYPPSYSPVTVDLSSGRTPLPITHHELDAAMVSLEDRVIYRSTDYADAWFKNKFGEEPLIVMTIRTTHLNAQRNAPLDIWYKAYRAITNAGYRCAVIPDQDDYLGPQAYTQFDWTVIGEASLDLDLRLALYRNSFANVAWSSGTAGLFALCGANFMIFGIWNEANPTSNRSFIERKGPRFQQQPPWFHPVRHRYNWHPAEQVTADYLIDTTLTWLQELRNFQ